MDELAELFIKYKETGDEEIANEIILRAKPMAVAQGVKIARSIYNESLNDVVNLALLLLVEAVKIKSLKITHDNIGAFINFYIHQNLCNLYRKQRKRSVKTNSVKCRDFKNRGVFSRKDILKIDLQDSLDFYTRTERDKKVMEMYRQGYKTTQICDKLKLPRALVLSIKRRVFSRIKTEWQKQ